MSKFIKLFCLFVLLTQVSFCQTKKTGKSKKAKKASTQRVVIDPAFTLPEVRVAYMVDTAWVSGDQLCLQVTYSGGCKEQSFELISNGKHGKSLPPVVEVYLRHNNHGDACRQLITSTFKYDITDLRYSGQKKVKLLIDKYNVIYSY